MVDFIRFPILVLLSFGLPISSLGILKCTGGGCKNLLYKINVDNQSCKTIVFIAKRESFSNENSYEVQPGKPVTGFFTRTCDFGEPPSDMDYIAFRADDKEILRIEGGNVHENLTEKDRDETSITYEITIAKEKVPGC